jgi:hypothetical protein
MMLSSLFTQLPGGIRLYWVADLIVFSTSGRLLVGRVDSAAQ